MENSTLNQLMQIKELFEKGILSREEMEAQKALVLSSQAPAPAEGPAPSGAEEPLPAPEPVEPAPSGAEEPLPAPEPEQASPWKTRFFISVSVAFVLLVLTIIFACLYSARDNDYWDKAREYSTMEYRYNKLTAKYPLILTGIKVGNTIDGIYGFDDVIYARTARYITPMIDVYCFKAGEYEFDVKLIFGNKEYIYTDKESLDEGQNTRKLCGFGREKPGFWPKGDFTVEIWHKGVCIGSLDPRIL